VLSHAIGPQERTKIVAAGLLEDSASPVLYAAENGAFAKAGLDVTVASQHSGSAVAAGIAGGSYQIGKISMYPLIEAHGKGLPFTIKHAKELNGATVAAGFREIRERASGRDRRRDRYKDIPARFDAKDLIWS
jgi:ABC-type nitrate/sulfonate/bicarbonate transport system substrate-binding protein